jgi:hypothetical protein
MQNGDLKNRSRSENERLMLEEKTRLESKTLPMDSYENLHSACVPNALVMILNWIFGFSQHYSAKELKMASAPLLIEQYTIYDTTAKSRRRGAKSRICVGGKTNILHE